ncbi:2,3-dihydro-2,3-dihydroxybenzoate dehydrogenase [Allostreptomyces psammosilenae]|uniref:2,3-dihydro-2,3-dihydroxybenzoate dehydrogenase n=1 Tax=Allostreptomyces psammosilenae TaxID=1892865 RepID=A0A853ACG6_9ACTN|nr:2,3-dihydro-2,3-dihydroxybenzoate dehydrogenase [Allostreptomyces psammosilenae]NYI08241.1 2,3-dihydro-2,3-dihydroxybenzoate dehydrogenase [Allostreptomyces psammosilenae]
MAEMRIEGSVALVTGAAAGIGAAVARGLALEGVAVTAADLDAEGVHTVAEAIRAGGGEVCAQPLDVTDPDAVERVLDAVESRFGPVDILVNVAGVLTPGPVVETTDEAWTRTFAVNATGVFHTSRAVARRMVPRRRGHIVTVASNAAGTPRAGMAAYAASKAAAAHFTRCLGLELAPHGIRCNTVSPGSTDTAMQRALWPEEARRDPRAERAALEKVLVGDLAAFRTGVPIGRIAQPEDIADAVLFVLSDRARHVVMEDLYVDGGATLHV